MNDISITPSRGVEGVSRHYHPVAAGILPAVKGGILPPGPGPASSSRITKPTALAPGRKPHTTRQRQILSLLAKGLADKQIAADLDISEETVAYHLRVLFERHNVQSRAGLLGIFTPNLPAS